MAVAHHLRLEVGAQEIGLSHRENGLPHQLVSYDILVKADAPQLPHLHVDGVPLPLEETHAPPGRQNTLLHDHGVGTGGKDGQDVAFGHCGKFRKGFGSRWDGIGLNFELL